MNAVVKGTFTPCSPVASPDKRFSLKFSCQGPQCLQLNNFMGAECTKNGESWSCSNNAQCSVPIHLQSTFNFSLEGQQLVSMNRLYTLNGCGLSLMSDQDTANVSATSENCTAVLPSSEHGTASISSAPSGFTAARTTESTPPTSTVQSSAMSSKPISMSKLLFFYSIILISFLLHGAVAASPSKPQLRYKGPRLTDLLERSAVSEAESGLTEIEELFKDYFLGKGGDLVKGDDWVPVSFLDGILEAGCEFLVSEATKPATDALAAAIGAPFIEDCILTVNSLVLVLAPGLLVPALIGGGIICDYLLEQFVSAVLHSDDIEEFFCGPLSDGQTSTSTPLHMTTSPTTPAPVPTSPIVSSESRTTESSTTESDKVEPDTAGPDTAAPHTTKPHITGSHTTESYATESYATVSHTSESHTSESHTSELESQSIGSFSQVSMEASTQTSTQSQPTSHLSGWTFDLPDLLWFENDISVTIDDAKLFLIVNDVKTVNTLCVQGDNFQLAGSPITANKGDVYVFETKREPNPDTCCLEIYSNAACKEIAGEFVKTCDEVVSKELPIDVRSWRVYGCRGAWTGET